MSSTPTNTTDSSSPYRVNYSEYVAEITGNIKTTRTLTPAGIGHHINLRNNQQSNRSNQQVQSTNGTPNFGSGADRCARCSKPVYAAEKKIGAGRAFHSSCFNCNSCHRKIDTGRISEHKGEIYCKICYSKQFGPHGVASGVTMSAEKSGTYQYQTTRRSSYGDDLESTPKATFQQMRRRANSTEDVFHDNSSNTENVVEYSQKYSQPDFAPPEEKSLSNRKSTEVDTNYEKSTTSTTLDAIVDSNVIVNPHRSNYVQENDQSKYMQKNEKIYSNTGETSKAVDVPINLISQRPNSATKAREIHVEIVRNDQRSQSPFNTSNDSYRRSNSRERQTDRTNDYSYSYYNTDNTVYVPERRSSNDNTLNAIVSGNPLTSQNYYRSSSYESKYLHTFSTNYSDRHSPLLAYQDRQPSALNDFITRTNLIVDQIPSTGQNYSVIDSLGTPIRQTNLQSNNSYFAN